MLLLINTQVSKLHIAFANKFSANIKLLKTGQALMGNILKPVAKSVLITLALTAAASATDAAIHKKMFGSDFTTLIISN